ncbi:MAG: hypothetical protein ACI9TI_002198 [Natronomonas sp.]|mgnify:CR=1 FL=1|jgi:hypothetical protein|uniref:hypothetical protein n=1 Tax=Natronomonas sp. TaxID=2184060 RepID=UPI003988C04E
MYDRYFEDERTYTSDEVLRRAYALGVASVCGDPDEETYDRLRRGSPDTYDESIIELAYDEGRARALNLEADAEADEEIWERLVASEFDGEGLSAGTASEDTTDGLPDAIRSPDSGGPKEGPPDRLDLPSFLRR